MSFICVWLADVSRRCKECIKSGLVICLKIMVLELITPSSMSLPMLLTGGPRVIPLCELFQDRSRDTWRRLERSTRTRITWDEETLTKINLDELRQGNPDRIKVRQFTRREEGGNRGAGGNGADWEWWIGRPGQWRAFRVQAKLVHCGELTARKTINRRYETLDHPGGVNEWSQMRSLIDEAGQNRFIPIYCFYNQWINNEIVIPGVSDHELQGCTLVSASHIEHLSQTLIRGPKPGQSRKNLERIKDFAIPWHDLVCPPSLRPSLRQVMDHVDDVLRAMLRINPLPPPIPNAPAYISSMLDQNDRLSDDQAGVVGPDLGADIQPQASYVLVTLVDPEG